MFWLMLVLPQFAAITWVVFHEMRLLRYEYEGRGPMVSGCFAESFSVSFFLVAVLGLVAVIGLCGSRSWPRFLYAGFAMIAFVNLVPDLLHPPLGDRSILCIPVILLVTMVFSFARPLHLPRSSAPSI